MDFLKILKAFEDFVYESLTWLILLPRTLVRTLLHPNRMTVYVADELARGDEPRFKDAMSPPLMLILCVLIAHLFDLGARTQSTSDSATLAGLILGSEQTLLLYRTIAFGVWALAGSAYVLIRSGQPVDQDTLRQPFYEQCYLVSPFALLLSISVSITLMARPWSDGVSALLTVFTFLWFWSAQVGWVRRRMRLPIWRCVLAASLVLVVGGAINAALGYLLTHTATGSALEAAK